MMRRLVVSVATVCVLAALAACGGSKANSPSSTSPAGTAASGQGTAASTPVPKTPSDPGDQELQALSAKFGSASFEVHYAINDTGSDQPLNGYITIYKQGSDRTRFDIASNEGGETVSLTLLDTPDGSIFCLPDAGALAQLAGVTDGSGVCFKNNPNSGAPDLSAITDNFAQVAGGDFSVTSKSTRVILGVPTTCYDYTTDSGGTQSTTCFTADGVPLYDKSVAGADTTLLDAVQVSAAPASDVFNTPFPVKDFPADSGG